MSKYKVSVILPIYNVASYLPRCLDSLLAQKLSSLEIVLVDDGSLDESGKICDQYAEVYSNIKVYHQKNAGVSLARNAGLRIAGGDYIGFVDPDDFVAPEMYEFLYQNIRAHDSDIAVCGVRHIYKDYQENQVYMKEKVDRKKAFYYELQYGSITCNKLFTREILKNLYYDETVINGEDRLFAFEAISRSSSIIYDMKPLYYYYHRCGSAGTGEFREKDMQLLNVCHKINDILSAYAPEYLPYGLKQLWGAERYLLERCSKKEMSSRHRELISFLQHEIRKDWSKIIRSKCVPLSVKIGHLCAACCLPLYQWLSIRKNTGRPTLHS